MNQSIEVAADQAGVLHLLSFADAIEQHEALSFDQNYLLRLVIEEIATNIVKYGYPPEAGGVIQLCCAHNGDQLRVSIRDCGRPFDPREHPDPDLEGDLERREVGGLGLFLVREAADAIFYQHDPASGWNELVVLKGAETGDV